MRSRKKIALTLVIAILLGTACPQIRVTAAEGSTQQGTGWNDVVGLETAENTEDVAAETEDGVAEAEDAATASKDAATTPQDEAIAAEGETAEEGETAADAPEDEVSSAEDETIGTEDETIGATDEAAEAEVETADAENEAAAALIEAENGIPVVIIEIDESEGNNTIEDMNSSSDHSVRCTGTMQIIVPDGFTYCDMDTAPKSLGPVKIEYIRGRGHSTWDMDKKPYKVKLDKKANVLGLGENKHWVLLANAMDSTVIKDRLVGVLGDQLGFEYTPNGVPVDVVMVGTKDGVEVSRTKLGSYLLAEQVRVDKNRLNIGELTADDTEPEDITGGYLVQYGYQLKEGDPNQFFTDRKECLGNETPVFDPSDEDYTNEQQKEYIRDHIQKMEDAILGEGSYDEGDDPFANAEGIRYNEYMDMESAAKYWLLQEVSGNNDGYGTGSTYFYKVKDRFDDAGNMTQMGKVYWGPLWDFDIAFGNGYAYGNIECFYFSENGWIGPMLYDDDENGFRRTAQRLWPQVRDAVLAALEDGGLVDRYYAETKSSYEADYEIWGDIISYFYGGRDDYLQNIENMKQWTRKRIAWLDAHMSGTTDDEIKTLDDTVHRVTYVVDGNTVRRAYYTDGSPCYLYSPGTSYSVYLPEKEGYVLAGWLDEEGNKTTDVEEIVKDRVFTALFVREDEATQVEEIVFRSDEEACSVSDGEVASWYTFFPQDAQDRTIIWTSSDETIAAVDEKGRVKIFGTGTVTITAASPSGAHSSYVLYIMDDQPFLEDLVLHTDKIELAIGEHAHIDYSILPNTARVDDLWFLPDDYDVVSVDPSGVVTGMREGTTTIGVYADYVNEEEDRYTIKRTVTVIVHDDGSEPGEQEEPEPGPDEPGPDEPEGHDLIKREAVSPGCTKDGAIGYWECRNCGRLFADAEGTQEITLRHTVLNALGHDWGEWKVIRKATVKEEGLEERTCKRCGEKMERSIPKLEDRKSRDTTDTGDRSDPIMWILLAVASLIGTGGVIAVRQRK